jgi:hypothetical protein
VLRKRMLRTVPLVEAEDLPGEEAPADGLLDQRRQSAMVLAAIAPTGCGSRRRCPLSMSARTRTLRSFSACRWRRSTTASALQGHRFHGFAGRESQGVLSPEDITAAWTGNRSRCRRGEPVGSALKTQTSFHAQLGHHWISCGTYDNSGSTLAQHPDMLHNVALPHVSVSAIQPGHEDVVRDIAAPCWTPSCGLKPCMVDVRGRYLCSVLLSSLALSLCWGLQTWRVPPFICLASTPSQKSMPHSPPLPARLLGTVTGAAAGPGRGIRVSGVGCLPNSP